MENTIFTQAGEKISSFEKSIVELQERTGSKTNENIAKYEKTLADLEQKARDLKKKLEMYKDAGIEKWDFFRFKFNHDLDEIGKTIKRIK